MSRLKDNLFKIRVRKAKFPHKSDINEIVNVYYGLSKESPKTSGMVC